MKEIIENLINNVMILFEEKRDRRVKKQRMKMRKELGLVNPNNLNSEECTNFIRKTNNQILKKNQELCDAKYFDTYSKILVLPMVVVSIILLSAFGTTAISLVTTLGFVISTVVCTNHNNVKKKSSELQALYNHLKMAEKHLEKINNKNTINSYTKNNDKYLSYPEKAVARHGMITLCDDMDNPIKHTEKKLVKRYRR